jgi:hypothetical protein
MRSRSCERSCSLLPLLVMLGGACGCQSAQRGSSGLGILGLVVWRGGLERSEAISDFMCGVHDMRVSVRLCEGSAWGQVR